MSTWFVYILECCDKTLYTGCTNDLQQRIEAHNKKQGAKYTRGRTPVLLKYSRQYQNQSQAQKAEHRIKQLTKKQKRELIKAQT